MDRRIRIRMRLTPRLILALVVIVVISVSAGASAETRVALSMCDLDTARSIAISTDIVDRLEGAGFHVDLRDADHKLSNQVKDIAQMIEDNPDYLVICAVKAVGLRDSIARATSRGVKVIMVDRLCSDAESGDILADIGADNEWAGGECARVLADFFDGKPGRVLEISGEAGAWNANCFSKGFRDAMCEYDNMSIAGVIYGGFNRETSRQALIRFIEDSGPGSFDAIFGHGDEDGIGAIYACFSIDGAQDIPIVSIGGQDDAIRALNAGSLYACVRITPNFGEAALEVIQKDMAGEMITPKQIIKGRTSFGPDADGAGGY